MNPFRWRDDQTLLCRFRVQPRSGQDRFAGTVGDRMKVRIRSAPVDGKANDALLAFLAKSFRVPRSNVKLVSGRSGKNKLVEIRTPAVIPEEILSHMDSTAQE